MSAAPAVSASSTNKIMAPPKHGVRRSQVDRAQLEKTEAERRYISSKQKADVKTERPAQEGRAAGDGRGRPEGRHRNNGRGRGRGGFMGDRQNLNLASGPFSLGEATGEQRGNPGWRTSGGISRGSQRGWTTGRSAAGPGAGAAGSAGSSATGLGEIVMGGTWDSAIKTDPDAPRKAVPSYGGYVSSDEEVDDKGLIRFDVEQLVDITNEEMDPMAPVRVRRLEHHPRAVGINADGATNKDGSVAVGANDMASKKINDNKKGKQKATDPGLPSEGCLDPMSSDGDQGHDVDQGHDGDQGHDKHEECDAAEELTFASIEDRQEHERRMADRATIVRELGTPASKSGEEDDRRDNVYLFQFPPILPDLVPVDEENDPETSANADLFGDEGAGGEDATNTNGPAAAKVKEDPEQVKYFDGPPKPKVQTFPSGNVGKLNIHKSGKATLDWGGISMCLGMGSQTKFLQELLLVKLGDPKMVPDENGNMVEDKVGPRGRGQAISMGTVRGKFIVTPNWDELLK